jgi:hypothetical protein
LRLELPWTYSGPITAARPTLRAAVTIDSALTESGVITKIRDTASQHAYYMGDVAPTLPQDGLVDGRENDAFVSIKCPREWSHGTTLKSTPLKLDISSYVSRAEPYSGCMQYEDREPGGLGGVAEQAI